MPRLAVRAPLLVALAAALAACGGAGPSSPLVDEAEYPVYETFDPAGYQAEPQAVAGEAVHDVPDQLMDGRVVLPEAAATPAPPVEREPRQVDGYRIQVFTSESRSSAERVRDEAATWLARNTAAAGSMQYGLPVVAYLQPYYRVRMGAFVDEGAAREALEAVRRQYPEAFIVSDLVTALVPAD